MVGAGREALDRDDLQGAASLLREAESLWRGRPLADLEFEPFARLDVERLEELRLAAVEERIDTELALGRTGLVPELEALIAAHPLRERLRAQLMRALYAGARQAEALAVYTDTRRLLLDELGIEPSEELRELERKVLNQDPDLRPQRLATPVPPESGIGAPPRPAWRRARGRSPPVTIACALTVVLIVGPEPRHMPRERSTRPPWRSWTPRRGGCWRRFPATSQGSSVSARGRSGRCSKPGSCCRSTRARSR